MFYRFQSGLENDRLTMMAKKPASKDKYPVNGCISTVVSGDEGDRTPGLGIANAALSQLSYIPTISICFVM